MEDKHYKYIIINLIIIFIFLCGAVFGALYSDKNNKIDIIKASIHEDKPVYLSFNLEGEKHYFLVNEITTKNYMNYDIILINKTIE